MADRPDSKTVKVTPPSADPLGSTAEVVALAGPRVTSGTLVPKLSMSALAVGEVIVALVGEPP